MPLEDLLGYGVTGLVLALLLLGVLVPKGPYEREIAKSDAKDAIIEGLTDALRRLADKEEAKRDARAAKRERSER